jgi:hypothetical protein
MSLYRVPWRQLLKLILSFSHEPSRKKVYKIGPAIKNWVSHVQQLLFDGQ